MEYTLTFAAFLGVFVLFSAFRRKSSLRTIPSPISPSWIFGNMLELMLPPTYGESEFVWQNIYGTVYRVRGCFGQQRLVISDPLALQHIIKSANFHHAHRKDAANIALYGAKSVPALQGEEHRRLRAALNVVFTAAAVSEYQAVLERIARRASDELEANSGKSINICPLLGGAALSAACELVFGTGELDEDLVGDILKIMPRWPGQSKSEMLIDGIGARFPLFFRAATLYLRSFNLLRQVQARATRVGRQVFRARVAAMESGTVDLGHDLYTKLLANASSNKKKLTDDEITAQTSVLLIAGHETTANTLAFSLLELARNPEFQEKLREEVNTRQGNVVYDSLPLLNAFIKEILRVYPAAALRERVALKDEIVTLSKEIVTTTGHRITQIPIRKGDQVVLALASYQRLPSLWGDDADSFNPYRWIEGKVHQGEAIGPYANLLSFFGGPHVCPGWRFAVLEMQVILSELIPKFSFTLPVNDNIRVKLSNTLQPTDSSGQKCVRLCVARNSEHV
ncbi:cytochrome P450 [Mycena albidolilacea]|uniref:Cytochrome P450 n=1 Tax=Mycena albidolilacea TaxID=1033008 RepID=A0AAD6Z8K0_9AGAR|nr:cytochrome P450 [Mycena albidolilacea]